MPQGIERTEALVRHRGIEGAYLRSTSMMIVNSRYRVNQITVGRFLGHFFTARPGYEAGIMEMAEKSLECIREPTVTRPLGVPRQNAHGCGDMA